MLYFSHPDQSLLPKLLFWQDVTEYGAAEDRAADRLLRMCNAWAIYNKYISEDSPYNVGKSFILQINTICILKIWIVESWVQKGEKKCVSQGGKKVILQRKAINPL